MDSQKRKEKGVFRKLLTITQSKSGSSEVKEEIESLEKNRLGLTKKMTPLKVKTPL